MVKLENKWHRNASEDDQVNTESSVIQPDREVGAGTVTQILHYNMLTSQIGTCEASRFHSNSNWPSDSIRFERDLLIRKFSNRIGCTCSFAHRKLSQTTQTINGA